MPAKIERPAICNFDSTDKTSMLSFSDGTGGRFYMRGGICWPVYDPAQGSIDGFALMAGEDVRTGEIYVFEQVSFVTINHVLGKDGAVEYLGLSAFFNRCWSDYFGRSFFVPSTGTDDINRRYQLQIYRSNMIEPKPSFVEVPVFDGAQGAQLIFEKVAAKKLKHKANDKLHLALTAFSLDSQKMNPQVTALAACLFGLEAMPYRKIKI